MDPDAADGIGNLILVFPFLFIGVCVSDDKVGIRI
jgi:hypothetical protein